MLTSEGESITDNASLHDSVDSQDDVMIGRRGNQHSLLSSSWGIEDEFDPFSTSLPETYPSDSSPISMSSSGWDRFTPDTPATLTNDIPSRLSIWESIETNEPDTPAKVETNDTLAKVETNDTLVKVETNDTRAKVERTEILAMVNAALTELLPSFKNLETSEKWRKGKLWIKLHLPMRKYTYVSDEICLAKDRREFDEIIQNPNLADVVVLFEIKSKSPVEMITPLVHVIENEKKKIENDAQHQYLHLMFKCIKSKSDFVTNGIRNRRNAQNVRTFLCATLYYLKSESHHEKEILWSPISYKIPNQEAKQGSNGEPNDTENSCFNSFTYTTTPNVTSISRGLSLSRGQNH